MKSRILLILASLSCLRACVITDSERAMLDDAASRALNAELSKLGPKAAHQK